MLLWNFHGDSIRLQEKIIVLYQFRGRHILGDEEVMNFKSAFENLERGEQNQERFPHFSFPSLGGLEKRDLSINKGNV